jgi:hypothetical protein
VEFTSSDWLESLYDAMPDDPRFFFFLFDFASDVIFSRASEKVATSKSKSSVEKWSTSLGQFHHQKDNVEK